MTDRQKTHSLVEKAKLAADPHMGGLMTRQQIQHIIKRLGDATEKLLEEREELDARLGRSVADAIHSADMDAAASHTMQ